MLAQRARKPRKKRAPGEADVAATSAETDLPVAPAVLAADGSAAPAIPVKKGARRGTKGRAAGAEGGAAPVPRKRGPPTGEPSKTCVLRSRLVFFDKEKAHILLPNVQPALCRQPAVLAHGRRPQDGLRRLQGRLGPRRQAALRSGRRSVQGFRVRPALTFPALGLVHSQLTVRLWMHRFVDLENESEQQKALAALDGKEVEGRALQVKVAVSGAEGKGEGGAEAPTGTAGEAVLGGGP